jgi:hypothetical protein
VPTSRRDISSSVSAFGKMPSMMSALGQKRTKAVRADDVSSSPASGP